jgi:hypothetical protein
VIRQHHPSIVGHRRCLIEGDGSRIVGVGSQDYCVGVGTRKKPLNPEITILPFKIILLFVPGPLKFGSKLQLKFL